MAHLLEDRSSSLAAVLCFGGVYILYSLVQYGIKYRRQSLFIRNKGCKPAPAYPHRDPIWGTDLLLENFRLTKSGGILNRIYERYIEQGVWTYSLLFGGKRTINTCEPENIKAILATQFKEFDLPTLRAAVLGPVFGHGIFTTNGKAWEASRALLRPNFNRSQIGDLETFESHITKLISKIPRDGSTVDLQPLFFMLTMDTATEFLFGKSTDVLGEAGERGIRFADAFSYVTEKAGLETRAGKLSVLIPDRRYKEDKKFVHDYVQEYVQKAVALHKAGSLGKTEEDSPSRYVFLEELAKTNYEEKKIRDELLNILIAGRDTTAGTLSFLWYTLARRPDIFKKLRDEVEKLGDEHPTFEQIKELKYLQWTLNEALRLFPIVPVNGRMAVVDTTLPVGGGPDGKSPIFVKAGQQVNYQVYVMHRRKDLYGEDAHEFKPERWEHLRPSWQYLPFNGGPRICIGQQFALIEASYTTIRILQTFKAVQKREYSSFKALLTLTAAVHGGVHVGLTPAKV